MAPTTPRDVSAAIKLDAVDTMWRSISTKLAWTTPNSRSPRGTTRALNIQRGLARINCAHATQARRTAPDGAGHNSQYMAALLRYLEARDEITTMFNHIAADVFTATNHRQPPGTVTVGEWAISFCAATPEGGFLANTCPATGRCVRAQRFPCYRPNAWEVTLNAVEHANVPLIQWMER